MPGLNRLNSLNFKDPKVLTVIAIILLALAVLLSLIPLRQPKPPTSKVTSTAQVSITKDGFNPATLSITKGTKVTFANTDSQPHQIQANPHPTGDSLPELKSEILNNAQTYDYTFTTTGSYSYHDYLNPMMNGVVEVKE